MMQTGKLLMVLGLVTVAVGGVVWLLGRAGFRGMPGDIRVESERVSFFFPVVSCLVLSAALTLLVWLWRWFTRS